MQIIAINEELDIASELPDGAEWCIYDYWSGSYEGSGEAYFGNSKGEYWRMSLGHCSCYGPLEHTPDKIDISDLRMHLMNDTSGIKSKILELKLADL